MSRRDRNGSAEWPRIFRSKRIAYSSNLLSSLTENRRSAARITERHRSEQPASRKRSAYIKRFARSVSLAPFSGCAKTT
jgi:hypothetical protein